MQRKDGKEKVSTRAWKAKFLAILRNTGNVRAAAFGADIKREHVYRTRDRDPEFAAEWEAALAEAIELLEAEARRRAMGGSDLLLIFLLKAHRPDVYRERVQVQMDIRQEAERIARENGLEVEDVLAEAQRIVQREGKG